MTTAGDHAERFTHPRSPPVEDVYEVLGPATESDVGLQRAGYGSHVRIPARKDSSEHLTDRWADDVRPRRRAVEHDLDL